MKPQDIVFIIVILGLLVKYRKKPHVFVGAGLVCLAFSIPLFAFWVFFTAERLVYYAAGFILIGIIIMLFQARKED